MAWVKATSMGAVLFGLSMVAYYFVLFPTTVAVDPMIVFGSHIEISEVNNIGLMAQRQNGILVGFGLSFLGAFGLYASNNNRNSILVKNIDANTLSLNKSSTWQRRSILVAVLIVLCVFVVFRAKNHEQYIDRKISNNRLNIGIAPEPVALLTGSITGKPDGGQTILHALKYGDITTAEKAINDGGDVNFIGDLGLTPLMIASSRGYTKLVKILLKKGAIVDARSDSGGTALSISAGASSSDTEILEILIDHGADVNVRDNDGVTPVMQAALYGKKNFIKLLLYKGANINWKSSAGNTALTMAYGQDNIIQMLKTAGENK